MPRPANLQMTFASSSSSACTSSMNAKNARAPWSPWNLGDGRPRKCCRSSNASPSAPSRSGPTTCSTSARRTSASRTSPPSRPRAPWSSGSTTSADSLEPTRRLAPLELPPLRLPPRPERRTVLDRRVDFGERLLRLRPRNGRGVTGEHLDQDTESLGIPERQDGLGQGHFQKGIGVAASAFQQGRHRGRVVQVREGGGEMLHDPIGGL